MHIDIVQDTVCPWCRIGKQHLKLALAEWDGEPVTVRYLPYFLNPNTPVEGEDFRETMQSKFRGGNLEQMFEGPTRAGAAVGLTFNFDKVTRMPNTFLSHRLVALTPDAQKEAMVEALYKAYFEDGQDVGDLDVLLDVAETLGLDRAEYDALLKSDAAQEEVAQNVQQMQQVGISGVPFFILKGSIVGGFNAAGY